MARGPTFFPIAVALLITLILLGGRAPAAVPKTQINDQQVELADPGTFAVFPWDILPGTKEAYEQARDCGFNLAGFVDPANLDLVQSAGLKCFVSGTPLNLRGVNDLSDEEIAKRVDDLVSGTKDHPAVFGYHIIDEPPRAQVPLIARFAQAFQKAAPNAVAYTNFLPIHGSNDPEKLEQAYEDYLTTYLDAAKPRFFSYDHYSLLDDGSVRPNYFQNLEVARRASLKSGVPFWVVALANSHFHYAEPSPATFRYQVFTSLAYGCRGMGWFTYTGRDRGNYRATAIDLAGHKTATWDMLRDANLEMQRLAPVYTTLKSVNVFHHPAASIPRGCRGIETSKWLSDVKGEGPFCVGEFENDKGEGAVIVVNCNLQRSSTMSIVPKDKAQVMRVSSLTGKTRPWGAEDNWLPPGGGILLLLEPPAAP